MDHVVVDYEFSYSRDYYPHEGHGYVKGRTATLRANATGVLQAVEANECPLVARLGLPGSTSTLDLRMVEDVLMRQVCEPGSKEPCSLSSFLAAAAKLVAWRDGPFDGGPTEPGSTVREPNAKDPGNFDARKWGEVRHGEIRAKIDECLGRMRVVGDSVYVPCDEPVLRAFNVMVSTGPGTQAVRTTLGWHMTDLDMYSSPVDGRPASRKAPNYYVRSDGAITYPRAVEMGADVDVFRLDREEDGWTFLQSRSGNDYGTQVQRDAPVVEYMDPSFLTTPDDLLRLVDAARKQVGCTVEWSCLATMPDGAVKDWMRARRILSRPAVELAPADVGEAMDSLASACGHAGTGARQSRLLATRWLSVEKDRDYASAFADDEAALLSFG